MISFTTVTFSSSTSRPRATMRRPREGWAARAHKLAAAMGLILTPTAWGKVCIELAAQMRGQVAPALEAVTGVCSSYEDACRVLQAASI